MKGGADMFKLIARIGDVTVYTYNSFYLMRDNENEGAWVAPHVGAWIEIRRKLTV
jgi:hypothetical protein